ncbi:MAG: AAA family ATPase [Algisphaera sp.]
MPDVEDGRSFPSDVSSDALSDPTALIAEVKATRDALAAEIGKVVVGQEEVVELVLLALFTRGHALLVGVPGLAKTLLVSTIAQALDLKFSRIQFTPDLMPGDITGTEVIEEDKTTGGRSMRFVKGPVFANLLLADEINRTPPKTQAALLEAMQERHVTAAGVRHTLPEPFFVLATQNPIEQEGTYPLPEAQLDRFMFNIRVGYPSAQEEREVIRRTTGGSDAVVRPVLNAQKVRDIQALVRAVPVADAVIDYALRLVRSTRAPEAGEEEMRPASVREYLRWGAGPRAGQALILAAKARAVMKGRPHPDTDDVAAVAGPVLRHRVLLSFTAEADGVDADDIVRRLLADVPAAAAMDSEASSVLR